MKNEWQTRLYVVDRVGWNNWPQVPTNGRPWRIMTWKKNKADHNLIALERIRIENKLPLFRDGDGLVFGWQTTADRVWRSDKREASYPKWTERRPTLHFTSRQHHWLIINDHDEKVGLSSRAENDTDDSSSPPNRISTSRFHRINSTVAQTGPSLSLTT